MSVSVWLDLVASSSHLRYSETSTSFQNLFVIDVQQPIVSSLQNDILDVCFILYLFIFNLVTSYGISLTTV